MSRVRENRTHGSTGGDWKRNATASPRQPPTQPTSCGRQKPIADFGPRSDGYNGLYGECRKCKNAYTYAHQVRNPRIVAARVRRWNAANPEKAHATAKLYRDSHPEQERARKQRWAASQR